MFFIILFWRQAYRSGPFFLFYMIIHNATFMIERERESEVILWLKKEIAAPGHTGNGCNPRVSAMREAGGVSHKEAEAASIAYQVEFPDEKSAREWNRTIFSSLADAFILKFGQQTMVFTSLFEVI